MKYAWQQLSQNEYDFEKWDNCTGTTRRAPYHRASACKILGGTYEMWQKL